MMFKLPLVLFILCLSGFSFAQCPDLRSVPAKTPLQKDPSNPYMAFRSSSPHFWIWAKNNKNRFFLPEISNIMGPVTGDAHALNFGDFKTNKDVLFTNIDVDDFGQSSVIFEAVRFFSSVAIGRPDLNLANFIESYLRGVAGQEIPIPSFLKFSKSNDFLSELNEYAEARMDKTKLNYQQLEILPIPQSCKSVTQEIAFAMNKILQEYPKAKILDTGYKFKSDGGSKGLLRIVILVQIGNHYGIFELKQLSTPATAYFNYQPSLKDRVDLWHRSFNIRPTPLFGITDSGSNFLLRPKTKDLFKFEKLSADKQAVYLEYVANFLGRRISQHPSKLLILSQRQNLLRATHAYVELFLDENLSFD